MPSPTPRLTFHSVTLRVVSAPLRRQVTPRDQHTSLFDQSHQKVERAKRAGHVLAFAPKQSPCGNEFGAFNPVGAFPHRLSSLTGQTACC